MRKAFISYARANKADIDQLVEHLRDLGCETWVDSSLHGGQDWWQEILHRIHECDVFIAIVSHEALNSVACEREFDWAEALGKPVLPVAVERPPTALPRRYSRRQIVDYSVAAERDRAARRLGGALLGLPAAPPPPQPPPRPPAAPLSYLTDLVEMVSARAAISHQQQRHILTQLGPALRSVDPEERAGGQAVLDRFGGRDDLYADVDRSIAGLRQLSREGQRRPADARPVPRPPTARATNQPTRTGPHQSAPSVPRVDTRPRPLTATGAAPTPGHSRAALRGAGTLLTLAALAGVIPPIVALGSNYDYPIQVWYFQTAARALVGLAFVVLAIGATGLPTKSVTYMAALMTPVALLQVIVDLVVIGAITESRTFNPVLPDKVYPALIGAAAVIGLVSGLLAYSATRDAWGLAMAAWGLCGLVEALQSYVAKVDTSTAPAADTVLILQNLILLITAVQLYRGASRAPNRSS